MWLWEKGMCLDLPWSGCVPSVCPELILHDFKCSLCSRDGVDNIHNCGRFLCNFSVVPPPGFFAHFVIYLKLFFIYTENIFRQAANLCGWWCWKSADSFHFCSRPPGFVAIFRLYNYVLLTRAGKAHFFFIILSYFKREPLFLPFSVTCLCPSHLFPPYRWQRTPDKGRRGDYSTGKEWQLLPLWSLQVA